MHRPEDASSVPQTRFFSQQQNAHAANARSMQVVGQRVVPHYPRHTHHTRSYAPNTFQEQRSGVVYRSRKNVPGARTGLPRAHSRAYAAPIQAGSLVQELDHMASQKMIVPNSRDDHKHPEPDTATKQRMLVQFYEKHNPSKLAMVPRLARQQVHSFSLV
jgi:hypothetical protein